MQKFTKLVGLGASLPILNIDTDMIIPKQFLTTIKRTGLGANLFYEMRYNINGSLIENFVLNQQPFSKAQVLEYLENGVNDLGVLMIKRNGSRFYMIDFDKINNKILNEFKKFLNEKNDSKLFLEDPFFKIPIWLMFYVTPIDKKSLSTGRYLIEDFKDDEITFDIKSLCFDDSASQSNFGNTLNSNSYNINFNNFSQNHQFRSSFSNLKKEELLDAIVKLITFYIKIINKKILVNILKEKNICDERLFPIDLTSSLIENEESHPNKTSLNSVLNIKNIRQLGIRSFKSSNSNLSTNLNQVINSSSSIQNKFPFSSNNVNSLNSSTHHSRKMFNLKNETFLDFQTSSRYYFDISIEKIYKLIIEEMKTHYNINNRQDIFKVSYLPKDEIFILKITLLSEDSRKDKTYSFTESFNSLFHLSNSTPNFYSAVITKKSTNSCIDERLSTPAFSSKGLCILVEFFGLENPSQNILKIIKDLVNEKALIVKVNHYKNILSQMEEVKILDDYKFLCRADLKFVENANKIKESIDNLFDKAKLSWTHMISLPENKITKLDMELICYFSDKINLESINPAFESLKDMSISFFDNLIDYFKVFKDNKIIKFTNEEDLKILVLPEIPYYAFLIKVCL